ncbi:MAG: IS1/IS6 family transposase [Chloroflexi bacterium]|nr:IS1/IS6 family transposase [Chloroflexota bacterium]
MAEEWIRDRKFEKVLQKFLEKEMEGEVNKPQNLILRKGRPELTLKLPSSGVMHLAKQHFTKPEPIICKYCGSDDVMKYGIRNGVQNYICRKCMRKFTPKDTPLRMRYTTEQIGSALTMFYDGLSLSAIVRNLKQAHGIDINPSSVYRWVLRYTEKALDYLDSLRANASDTWVVDETVIGLGGKKPRKLWFWDIICRDTKFLLASHLSSKRTIHDVQIVMTRAAQRTTRIPRYIISDGMRAYPDGIERVFGADTGHILSQGFTEELNTNLIERFHGTIKARTKVMRGFKTEATAYLILQGFLIHYNFFRPHMTLGSRTPAEVAGISSPFRNWTEVVRR